MAIRSRRKGITAVAVMMMVLTACGESQPEKPTAAEQESDSPSERETAASPGSSDDAAPTGVEGVLQELSSMPYEERLAELEKCAAEEGTVMLYGGANQELQQGWIEAFTDKYPDINAEQYRAKPEDIGVRIAAEAQADRHTVDMIHVNAIEGASLYKQGFVAPHYGAPIPEGFPQKHVTDWSATGWINPNVIAWNTDLVSEEDAPTTLDDLLDPKWKGKVAIDIGPYTFVAGLVSERGEEGARDFLQKLVVDNEALVRSGHTAMTETMAAGEFPVAVELFANRVEQLKVDSGAPITWMAPDPTATSAVSNFIYADAPHPCAAALFMHFLLSEEGSQVTADTGRIPANPNVTLPYPDLAAFVEEGTEVNENILTLLPELAIEVDPVARKLVEEIIIPRASGS